jgi:Uma2 family endonuclease
MSVETSTRLTYDDYVSLPEDGKQYEIIDGELYVNPAPNTKHQLVLGNIYVALREFVKSGRLGKVLVAPYDVLLSENDVVQPDLLFVTAAHMTIITSANAHGAPDIAVEIFSPGTKKRDQTLKLKQYERFGVSEYWMVDPDEESVVVCRRTGHRFDLLRVSDAITSPLLPGFSLPLSEVFAE